MKFEINFSRERRRRETNFFHRKYPRTFWVEKYFFRVKLVFHKGEGGTAANLISYKFEGLPIL